MHRSGYIGSHELAHLPFDDLSIMLLWSKKFDTSMIAKTLKVPEYEIYNRLLHIRERKRVRAKFRRNPVEA